MEDIFGNKLEKSDWNSHHVFARCTAKGKGTIFRNFINQHGLLLPMVKETHQELHAALEFPPLPSITLLHRVKQAVQDLPPQNPYDRFISITGEFESIADDCPNTSHREQSKWIVDNLQRQAEYILIGQVKVIEIED